MRTILDIGQAGAEHIDMTTPRPEITMAGLAPYLGIVAKLPTEKLPVEVDSGVQKDIEVYNLRLSDPKQFELVHRLALYEPMVYAKQGSRVVMGMASPNYDTHGEQRQASIKILPLQTPYPLVMKTSQTVEPDARMATMLAGAARAEGKESGSHQVPVAQDYEHKLTMYGAVSLGRATILDDSRSQHVNHKVKAVSSVARGLTDGQLGNIFQPGSSETAEFTGYGMPMFFYPGRITAEDAIYLPKSFVDSELGFGVHYADAARIAYGATLQILYTRQGEAAVTSQINRLAKAA